MLDGSNMATHVFASHSLDPLAKQFCVQLVERIRSSPIQDIQVVVPNHSVANWLSSYIADEVGICLNVRFQYLDTLFEDLEDGPSERFQLVWQLRILEWLKESSALARVETIAGLLNMPQPGKLRYALQLVRQLRIGLEFRTDWLLRGSPVEGSDDIIELYKTIWSAIETSGLDKLDPLVNLCREASDSGVSETMVCQSNSPILFGFWEISPLKWNLLSKLCTLEDFSAYLIIPSKTYLIDLTKRNLQQGVVDEKTEEILNPRLRLLTKLIGRGRSFQAHLLDQNIDPHWVDREDYSGSNISNLEALKRLFLNPECPQLATEVSEATPSIEVHSCTTIKRELEILKASIQRTLAEQPEVKLEDFTVYAPDMEVYRALIPYIFEDPDPSKAIKYDIREPSSADRFPLINTILRMVSMVYSDWKLGEIIEILRLEPIKSSFGFTDDAIDIIFEWLNQKAIVSGKGGAKEAVEEGKQPASFYSWDEGIKRLLAEYVVGASEETYTGMVRNAPSNHPELLNQFMTFYRFLEEFVLQLNHAITPLEQLDIVEHLLGELSKDTKEIFEHSIVKKTLAHIRSAFLRVNLKEIAPESLVEIIKQELPALPMPNSLGHKPGVQFASIQYENLIPSPFIAVLGLSEGAFPRQERSISYGLLEGLSRTIYDPSSQDRDLYWILNSIMFAEKKWFCSFSGLDAFSNERLPTPTIVESLLETLNHVVASAVERHSCKIALTEHPRNAFDERCFLEEKSLLNHYSADDFSSLQSIRSNGQMSPFLSERNYARAENQDLNHPQLENIVRTFTHASRTYARRTLGIQLADAEKPESYEPLMWSSSHFDNYKIHRFGLEKLLSNWEPKQIFQDLIQRKLLPDGHAGSISFQSYLIQWKALSQNIPQERSTKIGFEDLAFESYDLQLDEVTLKVPRLNSENVTRIILPLGGEIKKRHEIELWIYASAIAAAQEPHTEAPRFGLLSKKGKYLEIPAHPEPIAALETIVTIWRHHQLASKPVPFFPETSFVAYNKALSPNELLQCAQWSASFMTSGEGLDAYTTLIYGNQSPFSEAFYDIAEKVYAMIDAKETSDD
jgi:exodeoxyribonuclease V gamma subunit